MVLDDYVEFEVDPYRGQPGVPGNSGIKITGPVMMDIDSFFDVYLDTVPQDFLGPQYESLLHAEVLNQGNVIGQFWNLNPQSPEPATMLLLVLGALGVLRRRQVW